MNNIESLTPEEAKHRQNTASNVWSEPCWGKTEPLHTGNCQHCELRKRVPNYAGWARIYVEVGEPIKKEQTDSFLAELESDNKLYVEALKESIKHFGLIIQ